MPAPIPSPWPHRTALVLLVLALLLVWVGALVTTYDAGMAVPDWPGTYGQNMFAYPLLRWLGASWDLFIEHGHRLLGSVIGVATIAYVLVCWRAGAPRRLMAAACGTLALVIFQGALGGARVLLDERFAALAHGLTAPLFIGLLAGQVVLTAGAAPQRASGERDSAAGRAWAQALLVTAGLCYAQMALGGLVRHTPATASVGHFRAAVMLHLAVAAGLTLQTLLLASRAWLQPAPRSERVLSGCLLALVLAQVAAGLATWVLKYGWPAGFESWEWAAVHVTIEKSLAQSLLTNAHVMLGYGLLVLLVGWAAAAVRRYGLFGAPSALVLLAVRSAG